MISKTVGGLRSCNSKNLGDEVATVQATSSLYAEARIIPAINQ